MVGCLLYMHKRAKQKILKFKFKYLLDNYFSIYITTIGVINEVRKMGIASQMMNYLKEKYEK